MPSVELQNITHTSLDLKRSQSRRAISKSKRKGKPNSTKASKEELRALKKLNVVKSKARDANIITVNQAIAVVNDLGGMHAFTKGLESLHHKLINKVRIDPIEEPLSHIIQQPTPTITPLLEKLKSKNDLPKNLPENTIDSKHFNKKYPLHWVAPEVYNSTEFKIEKENFEKWATDHFRFDRTSKMNKEATIESHMKRILQYLGFVFMFCGVAVPALLCYLNVWFFARFISFLMAKSQKSRLYLKNHIVTAEKVCNYISCRWGSNESRATIETTSNLVQEWLQNFHKQVLVAPSLAPEPTDVDVLKKLGKWIDANKLLAIINKRKTKVEKRLARGKHEKDDRKMAGRVQETLIAALMFGWGGPFRPSSIFFLLRPDYKGPCTNKSCGKKNCPGNRIQWLDSTHEKIKVGPWFHHKTESDVGEGAAITLTELSLLFDYHIKYGRRVLSTKKDLPYIFVSPSGRAFNSSSFCTYFQNTLSRWTNGELKIPPSFLKHIFVDERRSTNAAPGPKEQCSARVMGNSTKQWDEKYDKNKKKREAQQHVDGLKAWREAQLVETAIPGPSSNGVGLVDNDNVSSSCEDSADTGSSSSEDEFDSNLCDDHTSEEEDDDAGGSAPVDAEEEDEDHNVNEGGGYDAVEDCENEEQGERGRVTNNDGVGVDTTQHTNGHDDFYIDLE